MSTLPWMMAILLSLPAQARADDPCRNGSFEELGADGFPSDWGPLGKVEVSNETSSGKRSIRLVRTSEPPTVETGINGRPIDRLKGGILGPVKAIARERGSRLMLLVALVWSVSAVYDKVAVLASSPPFYQTFFAAAFAVLYAPFLLIGLRKTPVESNMVPRLFLIGAICAVMTLSQFAAIQSALASYVIAVKRSGMIVSVILGYLFFKEENLRARLAGALLMSSGVVLLSV